MGKTYQGLRTFSVRGWGPIVNGRCIVRVTYPDGKQNPLNPHRDMLDYGLRRPFQWGDCPGGNQLAFALAYDVTKDRRRSINVHRELCTHLVCRLGFRGWRLTEDQVLDAIEAVEGKELVGELDETPAVRCDCCGKRCELADGWHQVVIEETCCDFCPDCAHLSKNQ
jgi:hypothetical protein